MGAIDQDITDRERRDQYLAAMGIQVWMPRPAPGEVSAIAVVPAESIEAETGVATTKIGQRPAELAELLVQDKPESPMADSPGPGSGSEVVAPQVESIAKTAAGHSVVPQFCLTAVLLPEGVLVVCDAPLGSGIQPRQHQALLGEILEAMGFAAPAVSEAPCFKWPVSQQVKMDQGAEVAREAVKAYINGQLCAKEPALVLLLGEVAASYLRPLGADNDLILDPAKCPVVTCPGLHEMLERPVLKASAWKSICEYLGERDQPGRI